MEREFVVRIDADTGKVTPGTLYELLLELEEYVARDAIEGGDHAVVVAAELLAREVDGWRTRRWRGKVAGPQGQ